MMLHCVKGVGDMTLRVRKAQGWGLLFVLGEGEGWGKKKGIVGVVTMPCWY